MQIQSTQNYNYTDSQKISASNSKQPSFEKIHRIQIHKSLFTAEGKTYEELLLSFKKFYDSVNRLAVGAQHQILQENKGKMEIDTVSANYGNIIREIHFGVYPETFQFGTFQVLKDQSGKGPWWLAQHLNIQEPKPTREDYHTFMVYTGDDHKKINKIFKFPNFLPVKFKALKDLREKLAKDEIRSNDENYWFSLLKAKYFDEATNKKFANTPVSTLEINPGDKEEKLFNFISESMPIRLD